MSNIPRVNRNDLSAAFNGNKRLIRAFEELLNALPEGVSDQSKELSVAVSKANQAIGQAVRNEEIMRGSNVLLWLSTI